MSRLAAICTRSRTCITRSAIYMIFIINVRQGKSFYRVDIVTSDLLYLQLSGPGKAIGAVFRNYSCEYIGRLTSWHLTACNLVIMHWSKAYVQWRRNRRYSASTVDRDFLAHTASGVETGGSGGSMNRGPELLGAPESGAKKFTQEKNTRPNSPTSALSTSSFQF